MGNCYAKFVENLKSLGVKEEQFINALFNKSKESQENVKSLLRKISTHSLSIHSIRDLFVWADTKEGHEFWYSVNIGEVPEELKPIEEAPQKILKVPEDASTKAIAILKAAGIEVSRGS